MGERVTYKASKTLRRFFRSDKFVRAIVGPVGSGKSSACVLDIVRRAREQAPDARGVRRTRWAAVRNTYPELRDTTRRTFEQWIPPDKGVWHEQEFSFDLGLDWPLGDGTHLHCEVLFRALDRPQDVKKLLSLEVTGAYFNELREIPKDIFDVMQTRAGRFPAKVDGGASWFGVWADTNPWPTSSEYYALFSKALPPDFELFEQPDGLGPDAENVENLPDGYYARMCQGKDEEWIDEYVRGKYPRSDKGSIYGELLDALERRGGVCDFEHPSDGVDVVLDLGVSDATALWFTRVNRHEVPDFIDWYEATGQPMSHYFQVIDERGWKIRKLWLPHDARARTFQTGVSTVDQFVKHFGAERVAIGPELSLEDGIAAGRWLLEQPIRFHVARCAEGLKRLRAYRYVWDEAKKVFTKKPLHDFSSHTSDSFRYVSCVALHTAKVQRKAPPPVVKPVAVPLDGSFTLDELFARSGTPRKERI